MPRYVAIPPGIYTIEPAMLNKELGNAQELAIASPLEQGSPLFLEPRSNELRQMWQISGDGTITSLTDRAVFAWTATPSVNERTVDSTGLQYKWLIKAIPINDDSDTDMFLGDIMTNDVLQNFWGIRKNPNTGTNEVVVRSDPVHPPPAPTQWIFTRVVVRVFA